MGDTHNSIFSEAEWSELIHQLSLSPQQARVALCVLDGLCDKQIAERLGIRLTTVRMHMGKLFSKLNVQDRTELVVAIFRSFRSAGLS